MSLLQLNVADWSVLKEKFKRKYNHLTDEDLAFQPGNEDELIERLATKVKRDQNYIIFTLKKGLANLKSNRL